MPTSREIGGNYSTLREDVAATIAATSLREISPVARLVWAYDASPVPTCRLCANLNTVFSARTEVLFAKTTKWSECVRVTAETLAIIVVKRAATKIFP